ncbi:MAG: hypothetical protein DYG89_53020 [Caldilinea sp. CFX5]|nr:hypothetical protein [Caldilinea sp. CFX5]
MLIILIACSISLCLACMYIYRQDIIGDRTFMIVSIIMGGALVYFSMVMLGVPYNLWQPMSIFVVAGLLLGFQASRVAIRLRHAEKSRTQSNQKQPK